MGKDGGRTGGTAATRDCGMPWRVGGETGVTLCEGGVYRCKQLATWDCVGSRGLIVSDVTFGMGFRSMHMTLTLVIVAAAVRVDPNLNMPVKFCTLQFSHKQIVDKLKFENGYGSQVWWYLLPVRSLLLVRCTTL